MVKKTETENKQATTDTNTRVADSESVDQEERIVELERQIAELRERAVLETVPPLESPRLDAVLVEQQNERIAELQRLVTNLAERMATVQAVSARDEQFNNAVRSVETAANAVQRGLVAPTPAPTGIEHANPHEIEPKRDAGCGPCECVSSECCTFEVWMSHVRVDQMQDSLLSPEDLATDSNLAPTNVMEIWMFASLDPVHNIGVCIPDASPLSNLSLHKQITDPYGPWVTVNRCVGTVTVKKGVPVAKPLSLTAVERENAIDRVLPGNRDEWGTETQSLMFDCCCSNYPPILISVPLSFWGQGGGGITAKFIVIKKC